MFSTLFIEPVVRGVQFLRDAARLTIKVPVRSTMTPVVYQKNWRQRERAKVNVQMVGFSAKKVFLIPFRFLVALTALGISSVSFQKAKDLLDRNDELAVTLQGRAAQAEALKPGLRPNLLLMSYLNK